MTGNPGSQGEKLDSLQAGQAGTMPPWDWGKKCLHPCRLQPGWGVPGIQWKEVLLHDLPPAWSL
jgi:hypothetical protein